MVDEGIATSLLASENIFFSRNQILFKERILIKYHNGYRVFFLLKFLVWKNVKPKIWLNV